MRPDAISERLHKRGSLTGTRTLDGLLHHSVDRENIITVNQDRRDTETGPASGEGRCSALFMTGNADSPAVILYYQHHRRLKDAREIQGFVEISLGRCSIATYTNGDCLIARYFRRHGQANSVQHLCANHDLNGKAMVLTRIVLRSKTAKCVDERGQRKPLDHQGDEFAVRRGQPVLQLQWSGQSYSSRLLAC